MFNFIENKKFFYLTELSSQTCQVTAPVINYSYKTWDSSTCDDVDHSNGSVQGAPQTHTYALYKTSTGNGGQNINARIELLGGSHVHLTGHGTPAKSIGHGTLNSTTAYLDLPSDYYTLMNDEDVEFGLINYNSVLGTNAIFGVKTQLDKDISTNPAGGTILIGQNTNATSQGHITITAPTTNEKGNA